MLRNRLFFFNALLIASIGLSFQQHQSTATHKKEDLRLLQAPGKLLQADASFTDEKGWTHYYNRQEQALLLSIYKDGQWVGEVDEDLQITTGLLATYGKQANDLSGADYIQNSIWLTMNRYWRIKNTQPLTQPIRVRFYFDEQDFRDIQAGLYQTGFEVKKMEELQFYALEGASIHPFATQTKYTKAELHLKKERKSKFELGQENGFYFSEFELSDLSSSGSGGILIPLKEQKFRVSGKITTPSGQPVANALFASTLQNASVRSGEDGRYVLANLQGGKDYEVKPSIPNRPKEGVTVLDLIALQQILEAPNQLTDPFQRLAADFDRSGQIDQGDLSLIRALILGEIQTVQPDLAWHFIPANQANQPLLAARGDEQIVLNNLSKDRSDLDFIAVKNGNLWEESAFPNDPPLLLDPNFYFEDQLSCGKGETTSFELQASDFEDIRGFQFTIAWDPAVLRFDHVSDFNLPEFDEQNIGTAQIEEGRLSFAWFASKPYKTLKLKDQTPLCKIHFRAIGDSGSFSTLNFVEEPTPFQVLRQNLSESNILFTLGSVKVENNTSMELEQVQVKDVSCFAKVDGSIAVQVSGGQPPYRYEWSNGSSRPAITGLKPGKYALKVHDGGRCPLITDSFEIREPAVLFLAEENIRQLDCPGLPSGAISFKTLGGTPPYSYQWSNGAATPWIGQLPSGNYRVTVTDSHNCQTDGSFEIKEAGEVFVNYSISHASSSGEDNGSVRIRDLIRIPGPHLFEWNNGRTTQGLNNLQPGKYQVTVTASNNCVYELDYEVERLDPPLDLEIRLPGASPQRGTYQMLDIKSPISQTIQLKLYDNNSQLQLQQIVAAQSGFNRQYFKVPEYPGTYMLQVLPQGGGVRSLRFEVK